MYCVQIARYILPWQLYSVQHLTAVCSVQSLVCSVPFHSRQYITRGIMQSTHCRVQCPVYSSYYIVYSVQQYSVHVILHCVHCTVQCTFHITLCTVYSTVYISYYIVYSTVQYYQRFSLVPPCLVRAQGGKRKQILTEHCTALQQCSVLHCTALQQWSVLHCTIVVECTGLHSSREIFCTAL